METKEYCSTLKVRITNMTGTTRFKCPNCGKTEIIRSKKARQMGLPYVCHECGFDGPN